MIEAVTRDPVVISLDTPRIIDELAQLRDVLGDPSATRSGVDITTDAGLIAALDAAGTRDDLGLERDGRE